MRSAIRMVALVCVTLFAVAVPLALAQEAGQAEKPKEAVAAPTDPISGDWDGSVGMPDGNIGFSMTLKVDKDNKVTGEIGSEQGSSPLTGTFVDGKLTISFTYVNGEVISLAGALKDGQLAGELSMGGGQMVAAWVASKRVKS